MLISRQKLHDRSVTYDVDEGEELAEEVSVGPPVVVLEVVGEVVQQQPLLLPLLNILHHTEYTYFKIIMRC